MLYTCSLKILFCWKDKPEVTTHTSNPYRVIEGKTATLECTLTAANPNTTITWRWFKTGHPKDTLYNGQNYTIPHIQRHETGPYSCTANNSVGSSEATAIEVDVQCEYFEILNKIKYMPYWYQTLPPPSPHLFLKGCEG